MTFKLHLSQFRCWQSLCLEIPIGGITLIKGASGGGKTTILQAITWCLYGNLRLVAPTHLEKARTQVTIQLPFTLNGISGTLTLTRQRHPNRFILQHQDTIYEDQVAQTIINDIFGSFDIWLASCYIGQGCRNSFLTAPNAGKMELLNSIAFHEEDPSVYISKIDSLISETEIHYKEKLSALNHYLNYFQTTFSHIDASKALSPEKIAEINQEIALKNDYHTELQSIKTQRSIDLGLIETLTSQLKQAQSAIIPTIQPFPINPKYASLDELEIIPLLQQRDRLFTEMHQYLPQLSQDNSSLDLKLEDYHQAVALETMYQENYRIAKQLQIEYTQSDLDREITYISQLIEAQSRLKLEKELQECQEKYKIPDPVFEPIVIPSIVPVEIPVPDYSPYDLTQWKEQLDYYLHQQGAIQNHLQHLNRSSDVLTCPHCKRGLRYQQNRLTGTEEGPTTQEEIKQTELQLQQINAYVKQIKDSIAQIQQMEMAHKKKYEYEVQMEQQRIDRLKDQIKNLELEHQRQEIKIQTQNQYKEELRAKIQHLEDQLNDIPRVSEANFRLLSNLEMDQAHIRLGKLRSINIVTLPSLSSRDIQHHLKQQEVIMAYQNAERNYDLHLESIPENYREEKVKDIYDYVQALRKHKLDTQHAMEEKSRIDQLQLTLQEQIQNIKDKMDPDPTEKIHTLIDEINDLKQQLTLHEQAYQMLGHHQQLTHNRNEVIALNEYMSDLHVMRHHAVETECKILQQVVDSINYSIEGVCNTLFDRDININLSLFKTLKSTKNVKPVVNFTIAYQGGVFDNINQMSGGEGDRASLALTLSMNRLSSCPLLMLDESLASLDLNMKEAAITTIQENTTNMVLVVMHDGVEGIFNNVIDVDELRANRY